MVGSLSPVGMKGLVVVCSGEVFSQDTLDYVFWKISLDADKFNSINNLEIYTPSCMHIILSVFYFLPELGT